MKYSSDSLLHFANDSELGGAHEVHDVADFFRVGYLLFYLSGSIFYGYHSVEDESVGIGYVFLDLFVDTVGGEHGVVWSLLFNGFASYDDVWRHIAREGGSGLYHCAFAYARFCVGHDGRREDDTAAYFAVARDFSAIAEDTVVADLCVVADVRAFHEEVAIADYGFGPAVGGTVDDYVFAYHVVVADDAVALLSAEIEVLRQCSDHGALVYLIAFAEACAVENTDEGEDDAIVAYFYVVFYIDKGEYLTVLTDFCAWRNLSLGRNIVWHLVIGQFERLLF